MVVSVAVCEIFSVKEWCDLENGVRVRSRSLEIAPFDRSHTSSYSPSIVTMAISSFARYSDLLVENRDIFLPHLYLAPRRGWPRRNFVKMFNAGKTRMIWLPYGKKNYDDMLSRFHLIPERYGRTDWRTDRQIWYINIARQYATRDKNRGFIFCKIINSFNVSHFRVIASWSELRHNTS